MVGHASTSLKGVALVAIVGLVTGCQSFKDTLAEKAYERMVASADEQKEAFHFFDAY